MIDLDKLRSHVADGVVRAQPHDYLPLTIYNYGQRCQYERLWDDVTLQCRGLVMHGDKIVAKPFSKFFNDTEHADGDIPWHLPCEVTEKLDGSLLIVFHFDGEWHYSTRGSFTSLQSVRGKNIFKRHYSESLLSPYVTYLFEVIYPENRIVVDYKGREDVVLLAAIETDTGIEFPLSELPDELTHVRRLPPGANYRELRSIIRDDEEGYVVRFADGFRVKIKGERYMQLHRLMSGISSRSIWECLSQHKSFNELLELVPDECGDWVRAERASQIAAFDSLNARVEEAYLAVKDLPDRKSQALKIIAEFGDVSGAAFLALDKKPTEQALWKQLYPEFRRPELAARMEA